MSQRTGWIAFALLVAAALGGGGLLWRQVAEAQQPPPFETVSLKPTRARVVINATGNLKPLQMVEVGAEVSGIVREVHVAANDTVTRGQLLATIYSTSLATRIERGQVSVEAQRTVIRDAEAALALAEAEYTRKIELARLQLISGLDFDQSKAKREQARAGLARARAGLKSANADLYAANEDVALTKILAPMDGVILSRTVEPGQTLATVMQSPVLFRVASPLTSLKLIIPVDEADIAKIAVGMPVEFTADAYADRTFKGVVSEISLEPSSKDKGVTYPVTVDVPNQDDALRPGMTANAEVVVADREIPRYLPFAAVQYAQGHSAGGASKKVISVDPLIGYIRHSLGELSAAERAWFDDRTASAQSFAEMINATPGAVDRSTFAAQVMSQVFGSSGSLTTAHAKAFENAMRQVQASSIHSVMVLRNGTPTRADVHAVAYGDALEILGGGVQPKDQVILSERTSAE